MRNKQYSKDWLLLVVEAVIGMEMEASSFATCGAGDTCDDDPHDADDDEVEREKWWWWWCREDRVMWESATPIRYGGRMRLPTAGGGGYGLVVA